MLFRELYQLAFKLLCSVCKVVALLTLLIMFISLFNGDAVLEIDLPDL